MPSDRFSGSESSRLSSLAGYESVTKEASITVIKNQDIDVGLSQ
jgi:hypothetical protein